MEEGYLLEDIVDFQSAMNAVRGAEESFMAMPAEVRSRFGKRYKGVLSVDRGLMGTADRPVPCAL